MFLDGTMPQPISNPYTPMQSSAFADNGSEYQGFFK